MQAIVKQGSTKEEKFFNLLSGATYGSSFVGMVHVLNSTTTTNSQSMYAAAASMQASMEARLALQNFKGGFGVDASFSESAMNLLSTQNITSHISLITMGVIPTIEANDVSLAVKQFTDFSPDSLGGQLQALQNANAGEQDSVKSAADAARTGQTMTALKSTQIQSTLAAVGKLDDGSNKMLDINSLMTAFTDYVNKAIAGNAGVPINYFLKPITRSQLAQMWVAKYLPGEFITSAGDDSTPQEPGQPSTSDGDAASS